MKLNANSHSLSCGRTQSKNKPKPAKNQPKPMKIRLFEKYRNKQKKNRKKIEKKQKKNRKIEFLKS